MARARVAACSLALVLALAGGAAAEPPPPGEHRVFGLGYKIGNGIGFIGADAILIPVPHLCFDMQGAFIRVSDSGSTANGFGLAPEVQYQLFTGRRGTPYVGVGLQYVNLIMGSATGEGYGVFGNVGYVYTFSFGLGFELGLGAQYMTEAKVTSGATTVTMGGEAAFNIEASVRYMIL
jgi:hypothetical protein